MLGLFLNSTDGLDLLLPLPEAFFSSLQFIFSPPSDVGGDLRSVTDIAAEVEEAGRADDEEDTEKGRAGLLLLAVMPELWEAVLVALLVEVVDNFRNAGDQENPAAVTTSSKDLIGSICMLC